MRQIYVHAPCKDKKSSATSTSGKGGGGLRTFWQHFAGKPL